MNTLEPTSISLKVHHQFKASHSLMGFETPHYHLWKLTVEFKASLPLKGDRLIDLVLLQDALIKIAEPIANTFLNDTLGMSPTSENLALYIWNHVFKRFPNDPLHSVTISLCDLNGESMGEATLS
jgi:6-pyruvoyl-tetrahydropterin synthase